MKKKIILFILIMFITQPSIAQHNQHRLYLSNIVSIGQNDFGVIIGSDAENIYFITADEENDGEMNEKLIVHFYGISESYSGQIIRTITFDNSRLYIYAVKAAPKLNWIPNYYAHYNLQSAPYYSYLQEEEHNTNWYANSIAFEPNGTIGKSNLQLNAHVGNIFFRGMPVVDNTNNIIGIIVNRRSDNVNSTVLTMIDMQAIADKMYALSDCKYFQLIQTGQPANRCETEQKASNARLVLIKQAKRNSQMHSFAIGPSFGSSIISCNNGDSSHFSSVGYLLSLGLNIETNPDRGRVRLVFKPTIELIRMDALNDVSAKTFNKFQPKQFNWINYECPIIVEYLLARRIKHSTFWGLGYSPGYQINIQYKYATTPHPTTQTATADDTHGLTQKFVGDIGWEWRHSRFEIIAGYLFSDWHKSTLYTIENAPVDPFLGYAKNYFTFGVELSFRLRSKWGIKSISGYSE